MANYTPGPWSADTDGMSGEFWILAESHKDSAIATVHGQDTIDNLNPLECSANAYLIATSPDLLTIIEGMLMYPDVKKYIAAKFPGLIKQAETAHAKAMGKV